MSLMSTCWKGMKVISLILLVFLTIICGISSYLLFTHSGNKFAIDIAQKIEPNLSMTLDSGSLFNNPVYSNISFASSLITIEFSRLEYAFDWACLPKKLCIEKLNADDMLILLTLDDDESEVDDAVEEEEDTEPFTSLVIPIEIDLKSLILNNALFEMPDIVSVKAKYWQLQAHALKDDITVINSMTDGLVVDLPGSNDDTATDKQNASSAIEANVTAASLTNFPAILEKQNLPQIDIFFNLDINAIKVVDFSLTQVDEEILSVSLAEAIFTFFYSKLEVEKLHLNLPEIEVDLAGEVDFSDKYPLTADLSGELKEIDFLQPKTLLSSQHFAIKSHGDFSSLKTQLQLSNKISAKVDLNIDLFSENLPHDLSLTWQNIAWPLDEKQQFSSAKGGVNSKGNLNDYNVNLQGDYLIEGVPSGKLSMDANGNLQNLRLEKLQVDTLNGLLDLTGKLDWQDKINWQGQLAIKDINLQQLQTDYSGQINGVIKQQLQLELIENKSPNLHFSIPEMNIDGMFLERPFSINGKLSGNNNEIALEKLQVNALNGLLDLTGKLDWQDKINWQGQLAIKDINLQQLPMDYSGQFNGAIKQQLQLELIENKPPNWHFSIPEMSIDGTFLERPFAIDGKLSGDNNKGVALNNILITNGDNKLAINGNLSDKNDLNIDVNIVDLSHLLLESTGNVVGRIGISGSIDEMKVDADLNAKSVSYQENKIQEINLIAETIISEQPRVTMQLQALELSISEQKIDDLAINITNTGKIDKGESHLIDLTLNSTLVATNIEMQLTQTNKTWLSSIQKAILYFPQHQISLQDPFKLLFENNLLSLSPHCWLTSTKQLKNAGELCIDKVNVGETGEIVFNMDSFLLSSLDPLLSKEVKIHGALTADADIKWGKEIKPVVAVKVFSNDMKIKLNLNSQDEEPITYPMENFFIELNSDERKADLSATISSTGLIEAKINGRFLPYQNSNNLKGNITLNVPDFSPFTVLIPELEKLSGQLATQIEIAGALNAPLITGKVLINDATIIAVDSPVLINRFNTQIDINNTTASIEGSFYTDEPIVEKVESNDSNTVLLDGTFKLVDKSLQLITKPLSQKNSIVKDIPGIAHIKGQLDWKNALKGELHFYADKMIINDFSEINMLVSPDIKLIFAEHIDLRGDILVDKGLISIKELPEGAVTVSKEIIVVDVEEKNNASDLPISMKLNIDLGNRLQVEALGLDTMLNGNLLIRKDFNNDVRIHGELKLVEGSYRALGQQLILQKSRITFQGAPESPYISIEAIRDPTKIEDNVTAGVRVTGTPDQLQLVIFSDPGMAQQEALSYITRGKSLESSSDNQGSSQIAGMLIDFGAGRTSNTMNDFGNKVGISELSLDSSGSGDDQSVGVSGYIAPGIEVSYGVGVFESFTILALRYEMFENFYIEVSSGIDQAIDAYYEFDWE